MIGIIIYENGQIYVAKVILEHLPEYLRELYEPFEGKVLAWDHGSIKEWVV
jgi:hypothetical protein